MKESKSLNEIIGTCKSCPYADFISSQEVHAQDLDQTEAKYSELAETKCQTIRDGTCKLANYAIENLFESKET